MLFASAAAAMQSLDDDALSQFSGQDGLTAVLSTPGITIGTINHCIDASPVCNLAGADASKLTVTGSPTGMALGAIGLNGAPGAGNLNLSATFDVFTNASNRPGIALLTEWERARLAISSLQVGTGTSTLGNMVLDASGRFELVSAGGLFNSAVPESRLLLQLDNGTFYIRNRDAAGPEVVLQGLNFKWDMPQGIVGIDANGLLLQGDVDFNLTFDLLFDRSGATPLAVGTAAQDVPILRYGWSGGLVDSQLRLGGGGSWLGTSLSGSPALFNQKYIRPKDPTNTDPVVVSEGLTLSLRYNYAPDFRWIVGEPDIDGAGPFEPGLIEFGGWQTLPNTAQTVNQPQLTTYAFDLPLVVLDVLRAGRGPGGLCWGANWEGPKASCEAPVHGGQFINVAPEDNSLAMILRDGFLRAYSTNVKIIDPPASDRNLGWALVYTFGNIDANIYVRPDERPGMFGMKLDGVLMSQTFDVFDADGNGNQWEQGPNWGYGTHFMIADTAESPCEATNRCLGIGLINSSLLVAADNLYINFMDQMARPGGPVGDVRPSGISIGDSNLLTASALTTSPVRLAFNGMFGGGDIPNMTRMVRIGTIKMNFEFDRFHFMLNPPAVGETYLGFEATMRFADLDIANFSHTDSALASDPGSFLMIGEPGRDQASIRLADAKGWLAARNGRIEIIRDAENAADTPAQLVIQTDLLIGRSVKNEAGAEFAINRVELSSPSTGGVINYDSVGSIVIPGGQWHSRFVLQPQQL